MTRGRSRGIGPACPACGHVRSTRISNGWSEPDDHYLRYKKCLGCKGTFTTIEVLVPADRTTFYRLDYSGREYRREYWRKHNAKTPLRLTTQGSDQIQVKVRVYKAKSANECRRGHQFTPENTYIEKRGGRNCRTCQRDKMRRRRAVDGETGMPNGPAPLALPDTAMRP